MQTTSFNPLSNSLQLSPPWTLPETHLPIANGVPNTLCFRPRTVTRSLRTCYRADDGIDDGPGPSSPVRLPLVLRRSGRVSQYVWDGFSLQLIGFDGGASSVSFDFGDGFRTLYRVSVLAVKDFFIPKNVSEHYVIYVKWKLLHRVFSSALQVIATQAMFRAIGVGHSRSLASAAALNWVLKDGLGRLSRCLFTASIASAFDTNLKRVRFSTAVLFSLSIGVELLTPAFPQYFLLLASIANIVKQISLGCYLSTASAVHRSFAVADNLGEVSAKAQIQSVCFDNLGLVLAAFLNFLSKNDRRLQAALPFVVYPIFAAMDLFGTYQGLKHVHLQTLTKDRLEIILSNWIEQGYVPTPAEVSEREGIDLLCRQGKDSWPIRIGCLNLEAHVPKLSILAMRSVCSKDYYFICMDAFFRGSTTNTHGILLCLREGARATDICIGSGGDDGAVWRWTPSGEPQAKVCESESCVTLVSWLPGAGRKRGEAGRDAFLVAYANGQIHYVSATDGRVEKKIEAHQGAVTGLVWSSDASTMATSGEDGTIKIWSISGVQRSTLVTSTKTIYCLVWGADSVDFGGSCILYTTGPDVSVKPLNPSVKKQLQWRAHSGTVLTASWSSMSNLIVTGGEDGIYKVWDAYGRNLFVSVAGEYPITSVAFSPDGDMFAVGSFMSLRVCDKSGWTQCRESTPHSGSVLALSWTPDSTQVVMATGSGHLMTGQLVDRVKHWRNFRCTLTDSRKLVVEDINTKHTEVLDHRDTVIKVSVGYSHIIVATTTQCTVYPCERLSQQVQFDLRDAVVSIQQCERCFYIADCTQGIQIYSYEGRQIAVVKIGASVRPELLANTLVSLSQDTCAVRDPADSKKVIFFDAVNGRQIKDLMIGHQLDILELSLSQFGPQSDRKLAFIDRNRDLFLAAVHSRLPTQKLATQVSSAVWNDATETLVAIADGRLVTWYYPSVVFVDRDLLTHTRHVRGDDDQEPELGRNDQLTDFFGTRVAVRRGSDGAVLTYGVSPYPNLLFAALAKAEWSGAVRLCRFLPAEKTLWGILAAVAVRSGELQTAEIAYAALEDVDKLRFMARVKDIPSAEGRQAELALFMRRADEAEQILLQAGLTYRAIEMHISLHAWDRAVQLAVQRRTHVDTVLYFRQKHLESIGKSNETLNAFRQAAQSVGKIDGPTVLEKVKQEQEKERQRGQPYVPPK